MRARRVLGIALLALAAGGCASLPRAPWSPAPAPVVNPAVPTADQLAMPYRTQAGHLERSGHLRLAVEAWTTALALAPEHEPSRRALKLLRERIERELAEQLRQGWHALARGGALEARQRFLAALALDPGSRAAQEALGAAPTRPAVRPAVLTRSEREVPEPPKPRVESNGVVRAAVASSKPAPRPEPGGTATAVPEDPEVLYAAAKAHLAARRDDAAYRALGQLALVSPGYRDSAALLGQLRPRLARQRYQEGLRLFREEQLEGAMEQWRAVLEIDPGHADARRNIEQAEKMLRTLAAQPKR